MVTVNWIVNAHKILVTPIVLSLMWHYHNWSTAAFLYLGLHATYTLLWLIKLLLGVFLHYVSDAQKYLVLQVRKGLIEDGLFARTRNPNYLGELLIYSGFVLA